VQNVSLSCKESFIARNNDLIYRMCNKMKNKEYHTAGTISKSIISRYKTFFARQRNILHYLKTTFLHVSFEDFSFTVR
jgi:hypothetical protein